MMATQTIPTEIAELPTTCEVLETERTHLNHEENMLLRELLRPGASIEVLIPPEAEPEELWKTLDACVRGLGLLEARMCRLKPVIGRILLIFENKPSLYKALGYETYSAFMDNGVYGTLGLHRTSAYEGKLVARDWPQVGPDRYAKALGPKKIAILSKFVKGSSPNSESWLETAESMKVGELREYCSQRGLIEAGETEGATITITTNRAIRGLYEEFFSDGRVQSKCGTKDRGEILKAMIQSCSGEWLAEQH
jgi:hypothetical protein